MTSKAVYTVVENGCESNFLSNIAGGYSYPFYIFNYAERMAKTINENYPMGTVKVSEVFPLMKANHNFPEDVQGESIFRPISEITAAQKLAEFNDYDDIPFGITLDYDSRKIGFVFNKNCPEIELSDMEINLLSDSIMSVFEHHDFHVDANLSESESEELFYKKALEKAAEKIEVLKNPVINISLVNDRYTAKMQLPASSKDMHMAELRLETSCLDSCEISKIEAKSDYLKFVQECSDLKFSELNELAEWTNSMLEKGEDHQPNKLAAVVEAYGISQLGAVITAMKDIDHYGCVDVKDEESYGYYVLYESNRDDIISTFEEEVENYIDFYHYGKDKADVDNVRFTSRGCVIDKREIEMEQSIELNM